MRTGRGIICIAGMLLCGMLTACGAGKDRNIENALEKIQQTEYEAALEYLQSAEEGGQQGIALYRAYGLAYMGMSEYETSAEYLERALTYSTGKLTEYEYDVNYYLATAYFKLGRFDDAIRVYSAILALRPDEKQAMYLRGVTELEAGRYEEAIRDFDAAIKMEVTDYSVYIDIYSCLKQKGYDEEAQGYLTRVMDTENRSMSAYDKGRICYYMGDYTNACVYLEEAYDKDDNPDVMLFLGRSYVADGNLNYASALYSRYLQENPSSVLVYNELGLCKLEQGDYQGALDAFSTALRLGNNDLTQVLRYNSIVAYEYLGQYDTALEQMEAYLRSYPDDENAIREYTFLKTR